MRQAPSSSRLALEAVVLLTVVSCLWPLALLAAVAPGLCENSDCPSQSEATLHGILLYAAGGFLVWAATRCVIRFRLGGCRLGSALAGAVSAAVLTAYPVAAGWAGELVKDDVVARVYWVLAVPGWFVLGAVLTGLAARRRTARTESPG